MGPMREIQSGSGYWSQNSSIQVMGLKKEAKKIYIQWPNGSETTEIIQGDKLIATYHGS